MTTSSAAERDFSTFELGDDVYELAGGLLPEIADRLEVPIRDTPNSADLQSVMEKVGTNKVLRHNAVIEAIDRDGQVELVERSGVQKELRRSLWTPDIKASPQTVEQILLLGAVANWQDRAAQAIPEEMVDSPVWILGGNRVMDTATEKSNTNVMEFHETTGRYPTEAEYIDAFTASAVSERGFFVYVEHHDTKDADNMLDSLFSVNPELVRSTLAMVRVANAGVVMAIQMRDALRKLSERFDRDPDHPQAFVITDTFPLATSEAEENDPAHFQKAATALRQVVLTAKKIYETSRE